MNDTPAMASERYEDDGSQAIIQKPILMTAGERRVFEQCKDTVAALQQQLQARDEVNGAQSRLIDQLQAHLKTREETIVELRQEALGKCTEYLWNEIEALFPKLGVDSAYVTDLSTVGDFPENGGMDEEKYLWQAVIDTQRATITRLEGALKKLAVLGGGRSEGNCIAQEACAAQRSEIATLREQLATATQRAEEGWGNAAFHANENVTLAQQLADHQAAIEVMQSSRDCMLAGFTTMTAMYQKGKMALREIDTVREQLKAAREAHNRDALEGQCHLDEQNNLIVTLQADRDALKAKYNELIMSVYNKWPNETRHETAKRYIVERETQSSDAKSQHALGKETT